MKHYDEAGRPFWICYTSAQVRANKRAWGAFTPYIPFYVCGPS